ncbi:hypothetical protein QOZ80_7AG0571070 [Eleusine coracana subsp. coracana]|nr:hypothetical protein QOZ80_7AG0571070 [Eleusine coracana subsp. coracana]
MRHHKLIVIADRSHRTSSTPGGFAFAPVALADSWPIRTELFPKRNLTCAAPTVTRLAIAVPSPPLAAPPAAPPLARVDGGELEDLISARCPRLRRLVLEWTALRGGDCHVVSIRSCSLRELDIKNSDEFQVVTPELRSLRQWCISCDLHIAAPKISEIDWHATDVEPCFQRVAYDDEAGGRRLRRLKVDACSSAAALMRRFDTVDELELSIFFAYEYNNRRCKSSGCPCIRLESRGTNNVVLSSLQEVQVKETGQVNDKVELVRLLIKCSGTSKENVLITVSEGVYTDYALKKIRSVVPQNDNVDIVVRSRSRVI